MTTFYQTLLYFSDGQWHTAAEASAKLQVFVSPEKAVKRLRYDKIKMHDDLGISVHRGKFRFVSRNVYRLASRGYLEADGSQGRKGKRYRITAKGVDAVAKATAE